MNAAVDPAWAHYPQTVLHFEGGLVLDLRAPLLAADHAALAELGLAGGFAIITACNPRGRRLGDAENERRQAQLRAELRHADPDARIATGASPDGGHREPGVAVRLDAETARAVACRHGQSAFFWYDGARFWIRGALADTPPIPLPASAAGRAASAAQPAIDPDPPRDPPAASAGGGPGEVRRGADRRAAGPPPAHAIVVLGGSVGADGELPGWVAGRVRRAVEAYRQNVAPRVIFTGRTGLFGPATPDVTEAAAMAAHARALGLPDDVILLEERARDTLGNAYFVRRDFLDPNGWRSIRVVTSDFHLSRAAWVFRKVLGSGYDFAFTSSFSGFSPAELIERALEECRISVFLNEWLESVADGDELSVEALMRHHHPAYSDAPTLSRAELERRLSEIARINRIEGTAEWVVAGVADGTTGDPGTGGPAWPMSSDSGSDG